MDGASSFSPPESMSPDQDSNTPQQQLAKSISSSPGTPTGKGSSGTHGLKGSLHLFSPGQLTQSVANQLGGEKSSAQQQAEQVEQQRQQQRALRAQQEAQAARQREESLAKERVDETLQLKQEAAGIGTGFQGSSAAHTVVEVNRAGDLSEQGVIRAASRDALQRKERQARQAMNLPSGPQKGPQMDGPNQKHTSTFQQMQGGAENQGPSDQDKIQRQRERALSE